MKLPFFSFLFLLLSLSFLNAQGDDDSPIVVKLATESPLNPVYLSPIENAGSSFTKEYLKQLQQVLEFDLNHTGLTKVIRNKTSLDEVLLAAPYDQFGDLSTWKNEHVFYIVKSRVEDSSLFLNLFDVNNRAGKSADPVPLTGVLNEDRRQVHKIADLIVKTLFGADGIASTKILFALKLGGTVDKPISEIWEIDYDGANPRQHTKTGQFCISPAYIPPKQGFASGGFMYVSYQIGQPKIFISSFKDSRISRLSTLKGNQLMPAISKFRDKVAFISDVTGNPDLFIQPFNPEVGAVEKPYQAFSARQATQGSPTFSPDGRRLAFVSDKDGSPKIYVIDIPAPGMTLKDVKATLISKQNRENSAPCWSPDGKKLAYCSRTKNERQIWIYDFTTNKERQITQGAGHKENPSWASNSTHLVFNSANGTSSDLFIINLNQSEATQITFGKGEKRFPSWEPRYK